MLTKFGDCFRATFFLTGTVFFVLSVWQISIWFYWLWRMRSLVNGAGPVT